MALLIDESIIDDEFDIIDKDGSGFIDQSELADALKTIYSKYELSSDPEAKAKEMVEEADGNKDGNKDGKISKAEFRKAFAF